MTDSINALVATNDQSLWMEWGGREEDSEQIAPSLASLRPGAKILHYANAAKEERRILLVVVYYGNDTPPPVMRFETGLFNRCSVDEAQKLSSPLALALSLPTYWTQTALAGDRDALVKLALATRDHAKQWGGAFRLSIFWRTSKPSTKRLARRRLRERPTLRWVLLSAGWSIPRGRRGSVLLRPS